MDENFQPSKNARSPEPAHVQKFISEVHRKAIRLIHEVTVPIFAPIGKNRSPRLAGTGVLIEIADLRMLLTASHVTKTGTKDGFDLCICASPPAPFVSIRGSRILSTPPQDQHDVAVVILPDNVVGAISTGRRFLRPDQLAPGYIPKNGVYYAVAGFPDESRVNLDPLRLVQAQPLAYGTRLFSGNPEELPDFDPAVRMAFDFYPDQSFDDQGSQLQVPQPFGMSGCGIWRLFQGPIPGGRRWSADEIRLIGIEHRWYIGHNALVGTGIRWAIQVIWDKFPGLRNQIESAFKKGA